MGICEPRRAEDGCEEGWGETAGGLHLPYRTKVVCHAYPIYHDEDLYIEAKKFEPFRWCNEENGDAEGLDFQMAMRVGETRKGTSLVTTSTTFMAFSHGLHSWLVYFITLLSVTWWIALLTNSMCSPGRFFASQQLKLTLEYISLNYDIKQIPCRTDNKWCVGSGGPPLNGTICVRRWLGTA